MKRCLECLIYYLIYLINNYSSAQSKNDWAVVIITSTRDRVLSNHKKSKSLAERKVNNIPLKKDLLQLVLIQKLVNTMLEKYCSN